MLRNSQGSHLFKTVQQKGCSALHLSSTNLSDLFPIQSSDKLGTLFIEGSFSAKPSSPNLPLNGIFGRLADRVIESLLFLERGQIRIVKRKKPSEIFVSSS